MTTSSPFSLRRSVAAIAVTCALGVGLLVPLVVAPEPAAAVSVSGIVNTYDRVIAISGSSVTLAGNPRGAAGSWTVGDEVLLIQMTGVAPAVSGSNFGNYERAKITAVAGVTVTLSAIARSYSPSSEAVQLVRVPSDPGTITLSGTVNAAPWDGSTGGVIALSGGTLDMAGRAIDATGAGFTSTLRPTAQVVAAMSSGPGATVGRGSDGHKHQLLNMVTDSEVVGLGGGGIGGGGGGAHLTNVGNGGGLAGGAFTGGGAAAAGVDGGAAVGGLGASYGGATGSAGGGGGILGGGGGGAGGYNSGGGGGVGGGGSGALYQLPLQGPSGSGAGGVGSVGNGGSGMAGGVSGTATNTSSNEGSAGGGGGSYGGGGGAGSNYSGGDDGAGGGGGGGWTGGGPGGTGGSINISGPIAYPAGGSGNAAVAAALPNSAHYLNADDPRLFMGGAGGTGSAESGSLPGGAGGGIVVIHVTTLTDSVGGGAIRSDGGNGQSPVSAGGGAHSGAGGGGGGQMRLAAETISGGITVSAKGGRGGDPTANLFHGGVGGAGGGGGGVWFQTGDATQCPATSLAGVSFGVAGGVAGSSMINPKNDAVTATSGAGGNGLACVSPAEEPIGPPSISIGKALDGSRAEPGDQFTMQIHTGTAGGPIVASSSTSGSGATVTGGRASLDPGVSGTTYVLTETGAGGADLTDYAAEIACVDTAGIMTGPFPQAGVTGTTPVAFDPVAGHAVTPVDGADIECTVTNRALSSELTFDKSLVSSTRAADGRYTVVYDITVRNEGELTEVYSLDDTLRPGSGAVFVSASWTGPTSGSFTGIGVATTLSASQSIAAAATHVYRVTALYDVDPRAVTGAGATASNECRADGQDFAGSFGFHNVAEFTWNGATSRDDACAPFPFSFVVSKVLDGTRANPSDQFRVVVRAGSIAGPIVGTSTTSGSDGTVTSGTGVVRIDPAVGGATYVLTEEAASGSLSDYETQIACVDTAGVMTGPFPQGGVTGTLAAPGGADFDPAVGHTLVPVAGSAIECAITNRALVAEVDFAKDLESATRNADGTTTAVYTITVRNVGEKDTTYSLSDTLHPGAGAEFVRASWDGPTTGSFDEPEVLTPLTMDHPIAVAAGSSVHVYTVTAVYRIVPSAVTGSGINASNVCKPDDSNYSGSFALHNTAVLFSGDVALLDDACAPFSWPAPALASTGSVTTGLPSELAAIVVLIGLGVLTGVAVRRRTVSVD